MSKKKYDTIAVEKKDGVAWVTLNIPQRLNAITLKMIKELASAIDELEEDKDVKCVVLKGAGDKAFSVGADVTMFSSATPTKTQTIAVKGQELTRKIELSSKPFIAAVNGYCLGGGLEIALACDFRIATENSEFGSPEIRLGIIPGWGATQRLPRIVGLAKAKELVMFGDRISAEEALKIGLINKIVSREKFEEEVEAFVKKLVEGPPIALKYAKHVLNFGSQASLEVGLKVEAEALGILASTNDAVEGISAFFEKRKPEFKGE